MDIDKSQIQEKIDHTFDQYINQVERVENDRIGKSPSTDSWSAGQVCDHILKVCISTMRLLRGEGKPVDRDPAAKVEYIGKEFANVEKQFQAFGPIRPDEKPPNRRRIISGLNSVRKRFHEYLADDPDLTLLCTQFTHPLFGEMTRLEWLYFIIYHNERHLGQLRRTIENT